MTRELVRTLFFSSPSLFLSLSLPPSSHPLQTPRLRHTRANQTTSPGYTSTAAASLRDALLNDTTDAPVSVHSRVLGNVIYFMASLTAETRDLQAVEEAVGARLGRG